MAHCPTCQQHPGTMRIAWASLLGKKGKRFECVHCFRALAVPVWQRKVAWAWTIGLSAVVVGGLFGLNLWLEVVPWWLLGMVVAPVVLLVWARWWATVVRPDDAMMARPPRRHSRTHRRKQKLM